MADEDSFSGFVPHPPDRRLQDHGVNNAGWSADRGSKLKGKILKIMNSCLTKSLYDVRVCCSNLMLPRCSATTPVSYPASLRNFPNGYKGHPRFYPPPDRPPITKPDPNSVRTRAVFYSTMAWVDKKCISVLKPENRKRSI